jgi:hypothetical protein
VTKRPRYWNTDTVGIWLAVVLGIGGLIVAILAGKGVL